MVSKRRNRRKRMTFRKKVKKPKLNLRKRRLKLSKKNLRSPQRWFK